MQRLSNEQLVKEIQNGKHELMNVLWEQVEKFVYMQASKRAQEIFNMDIVEDLFHEGYFAVVEAVKCYDESRGMFTTYLNYHLQKAFLKAQNMYSKGKNDPIHNYISLETPLYNFDNYDNKETLVNTIEDPNSLNEFKKFEDCDYYRDINLLLRDALLHVKDDKSKRLIEYINFQNVGTTVKQGCNALDIPNGKHYYEKGIREMRQYLQRGNGKILKDYDLDHRYYNTGLNAFKYKLFTSSVEEIVLSNKVKPLKNERK